MHADRAADHCTADHCPTNDGSPDDDNGGYDDRSAADNDDNDDSTTSDDQFGGRPSTVVGDSVVIGIENGGAVPGTFQRAACIAATTAFNPRTVGDTFSVSVAAPPGMTISRVQYVQLGNRLLERSTYWLASGSGELTAAGVSVPFSFTTPGLGRSIDLAGRNVDSTTISVSISMSAGRSNNHPRVTNPPGSAFISVTSATIIVEYA